MKKMKINDTNVCLRLGKERRRLNLNQHKVADYCDVSVKTIGRWEKSTPIPADKLALLVQLGYNITYILTGVKLIPQVSGLQLAANHSDTHAPIDSDMSSQDIVAISKEQATWLNILESLAGGDRERLKQIGLALVGYSQSL